MTAPYISWMLTRNAASTAANGGTATFKLLHDAIVATGMVQTSDTGQLDMTSSPAYSTTSGNNYGYTVYKFDDAAAATLPIYFRIDWINGGQASPCCFAHKLTIGTGSNGSGTITGSILAATAFSYGAGSAGTLDSTPRAVYVGGDGSCIYVAFGMDDSNGATSAGAHFFVIDRGRDSSGVPCTTSFWFGYGCGASSSSYRQRVYSTTNSLGLNSPSTTPGPSPSANTPWPWAAGTEQAGTTIPAFPYQYLDPALYSSMAVLLVPSLDMAYGTVFSVTHLGSTHTYVSLGANNTAPSYASPAPVFTANNTNNNYSLAMLYE